MLASFYKFHYSEPFSPKGFNITVNVMLWNLKYLKAFHENFHHFLTLKFLAVFVKICVGLIFDGFNSLKFNSYKAWHFSAASFYSDHQMMIKVFFLRRWRWHKLSQSAWSGKFRRALLLPNEASIRPSFNLKYWRHDIQHDDTQHNNIKNTTLGMNNPQRNVTSHYAECRYAGCRIILLLCWVSSCQILD